MKLRNDSKVYRESMALAQDAIVKFHCAKKLSALLDSSHESATESIGYSNDVVISSSFRHQLGFLLTSRERMQLKKALQIYEERRCAIFYVSSYEKKLFYIMFICKKMKTVI